MNPTGPVTAVYALPGLPNNWVVERDGLLWIVEADGSRPRPYRGYAKSRLERLGWRVDGPIPVLAMATVLRTT